MKTIFLGIVIGVLIAIFVPAVPNTIKSYTGL